MGDKGQKDKDKSKKQKIKKQEQKAKKKKDKQPSNFPLQKADIAPKSWTSYYVSFWGAYTGM